MRRQGRKGDLDPFFKNTLETKVEDKMSSVKSQIENYYSEPTTTEKAPRRLLVFLKLDRPSLDPALLKLDLERELGADVSIFLNQDQDLIREIVEGNPSSVILNLSVAPGSHELTGNIFSEGVPLENLEGDQFEEALQILNTTRYLLEKILMSSKHETEKVMIGGKKIIVMINSVFPISQEVISLLKARLEEAFAPPTVIVIHINESQEVLNREYRTDKIPILVTITVDRDTKNISGNLFYGTEALDNIQEEEKRNEAFEILDIVKGSLETNFLPQISTEPNVKPIQVNSFDFYEYESSAGDGQVLQSQVHGDVPRVVVDDYFMADESDLPETKNYLYYEDEVEEYDDGIVGVTNPPTSYEDVDFGLIQEITNF